MLRAVHRAVGWLPLAVLLATGTGLMLSVSPLVRSVPGRDSGVFLYVASTILDGGLPYRDVWDHKPPAIYYLDALGLALTGRSLWGVWALQTLFVCSTIVLGFTMIKKALGSLPALFGSVAWISMLGLLLIWENYPEEYALPLQFGSLFLLYNVETPTDTSQQIPWEICCETRRRSWRFWRKWLKEGARHTRRRSLVMGTIGALAAASFLLKPTLVGTCISIVLFLALRGLHTKRCRRSALYDIGSMLTGALLLVVPVTAYLGCQGVLEEALDAVFRYNLFYSAASPTDRLLSILSGLGGLPALSGAPALSLLAWAMICGDKLRRRSGKRTLTSPFQQQSGCDDVSKTLGHGGHGGDSGNGGGELLSEVAFIALPVELLLVAIPGRSYGYYYTAWLPCLALLSALFARRVLHHLGTHATTRSGEWWQPLSTSPARVRVACLCALLPVLIGIPAAVIAERIGTRVSTAVTRVEAVRYIVAHTSATDRVLIWGAEPGVGFAARRPSPTRFVYQYPLFTRGYADASLVREFLLSLEADPPALIVDASSSDKITPPLDESKQVQWRPVLVYELPPGFDRILRYLDRNYRRVGSLGPDGWDLYIRRSP